MKNGLMGPIALIALVLGASGVGFGIYTITMTDPQQDHALDDLQAQIDLLELNVNLLNMSLEIYHNQLLTVNTTLTTLYQDLNISLQSLQQDVQNQLTMINNLQSNLDTVNQTLVALEAVLSSNITSLDTRLTIVETTIGTIQTTISSMQTDITNLQTNVTSIQSILDEIYLDGTLRVPSYSSPPFAADAAHAGCMYFNNLTKLIYYCDGAMWVPVGSRNGTIVQITEVTSTTQVETNNTVGFGVWRDITTMELNYTTITDSTLIIEFCGMFTLWKALGTSQSGFVVRIRVNGTDHNSLGIFQDGNNAWNSFSSVDGYMKLQINASANELYEIEMRWICTQNSESSIYLGGIDNPYSIWVTEIAGWL